MRLFVRRHQSQSRKGTKFSLSFQLGLLPEEQKLVDQYALHGFQMGTVGTLRDLLRGVEREAGVMVEAPVERLLTRAGAHVQDAVRIENAVKKSCRDLGAVLSNLGTFDGEHAFDYESTSEPGDRD